MHGCVFYFKGENGFVGVRCGTMVRVWIKAANVGGEYVQDVVSRYSGISKHADPAFTGCVWN